MYEFTGMFFNLIMNIHEFLGHPGHFMSFLCWGNSLFYTSALPTIEGTASLSQAPLQLENRAWNPEPPPHMHIQKSVWQSLEHWGDPFWQRWLVSSAVSEVVARGPKDPEERLWGQQSKLHVCADRGIDSTKCLGM